MIAFPNQMRNYDEDAGTFRFSGYDGVMEVRFVLDTPALERLAGISPAPEADYPAAFDRCRKAIETAAIRAYRRNRKSLIRLTVADFASA
ncbi:MAG: DUF1488 family protein [Hoeflea sp.]|uniref:DUF1488 family protein n=1 Tax=Hoeflea sp. TaxID=1940281 RepID=UPI0032EE9238